jgi:translation initiation factor 1
MCPTCGHPSGRCRCRRRSAPAVTGDGVARVRRETKGRAGRTVTTISGLPLPPDELHALARELKRRCGTGGALKKGVIEIQGDHADALLAELAERGFRAKRAGG